MSILDHTQLQKMIGFNDTVVDLPPLSVLELIALQVKNNPDAIAIEDAEGEISYGDLERSSNKVSNILIKSGVRPGMSVGVCLRHSRLNIISVLAIFKAKAVYIPLDPEYPRERLEYMIDDSELKHALCTSNMKFGLPSSVIKIEIDNNIDVCEYELPFEPDVSIDHAYTIYTSGSTGRPKGVDVSHKSLINFLWHGLKELKPSRADVFFAVASVNFDMSILDLLLPLVAGSKVVVANQEAKQGQLLLNLLKKTHATILQATPSAWRLLMHEAQPGDFKPGFKCLTGGEALTSDLAKQLLSHGIEVWNGYGPTETTVFSSHIKIDDATDITIGRPIANTTFYVLDKNMCRLPPGVAGELYIGGLGVASGYRNRPELSKERFLKDPFPEALSPYMYKTGDKVRLLDDGRYEYLGRIDNQVKLRGYRIELEEIEQAFFSQEEVKDCAVVLHTLSAPKLVAYIVGDPAVDIQVYTQALRDRLPSYMLPQHIEFLDSLPLLPNGKVDRKALSIRSMPSIPTSGIIDLDDLLEKNIVYIFRLLLQNESVEVNDDFFEHGGHSLLALKFMQEIHNSYGITIPVGLIYESPTPRELAKKIRNLDTLKPAPVKLNEATSGVNLFLLGGMYLYKELAKKLESRGPVYGVYITNELNISADEQQIPSVRELAADYIKVIQSIQSNGPYHIGGLSFGGLVAYEVGQQLRALGYEVKAVYLFDTVLPSVTTRIKQVISHRNSGIKYPYTKIGAFSRRFVERIFPSTVPESTEHNSIDAQRMAWFKYATKMYVGGIKDCDFKVLLFAAMHRIRRERFASVSCGWRFLGSKLDLRKIEADHLSIVEAPAVQLTAEAIVERY